MTKLCDIQKWFGTLIGQPIATDQKIGKITPFGTSIQEEAEKYLTPSPTLAAHQRLEIYHQQYWWRILKCLQENFPTLVRLYGYEEFNRQIGVPYFSHSPPTHWALCQLGQSLPFWLVDNSYRDLDCDTAHIDAAAQRAFWVKQEIPIDFSALSEEEILSKPLILQPHVHLFALGGDLFTFRDILLKKSVDYWDRQTFPAIQQRTCFFVLYRNPKNQVRWKELLLGEYHLLKLFQEGITIKDACNCIEKEEGHSYQEAQELLPLWFREWTFLRWFRYA